MTGTPFEDSGLFKGTMGTKVLEENGLTNSTERKKHLPYSLVYAAMNYAIGNLAELSLDSPKIASQYAASMKVIFRLLKEEGLVTDYGVGYIATIKGIDWMCSNLKMKQLMDVT